MSQHGSMRQERGMPRQDTMRKNNPVLTVILTALMAVAIGMGTESIQIAGINVYTKVALFAAVFVIGFAAFVVSPDFARLSAVGSQFGIVLLPAVLPALWSHVIWITSSVDFIEVRRGYRNTVYLFIGFCGALALVYVAGEKAAWCYLVALLAAYMNTMISVIREGGAAAFFTEFFELLRSFANDTGPLMKQMELHEVVYAIGSYLIFFLLQKKNLKIGWPLFLLTLFCFLTGLKRIAVVAVLVAVFMGWILLLFRWARTVELFFVKLLGCAFLVMILAYVGAVYYGFFDYLETIGINTMERAVIYRAYSEYFRFSPFFFGNGTSWTDNFFQTMIKEGEWTAPIHNDYLRMFMELGMIGYLLWAYTKCILPVKRAFRQLGMEGGILILAFVTYMAVTYMVDATVMYLPLNISFAIVMMSYRLTEREKEKEVEMERANRMLSEG